jgi:hypothetical protein
MKNNKTLIRRNVIGGATALAASAAVIPTSVLAQSRDALIDAFYVQGKYTSCDAKVLASYWADSPDINNWGDAKRAVGELILGGDIQLVKRKLTAAGQAWKQAGQSCSFSEIDNPSYSENDLEDLRRYWNSKGENLESTNEAKLKVIQNVIGGGNPWVTLELEMAR